MVSFYAKKFYFFLAIIKESVRQNVHLIEKDLMVCESNLIDYLGDYFDEEELNDVRQRTRSDQAHLFIERLEIMDVEHFNRILEILKMCSFTHIADALHSSFLNMSEREYTSYPSGKKIQCALCRMQNEVDIKGLRCNLKFRNLLPDVLYSDINACHDRKGHQGDLWRELFCHLKSFKDESVERKFVDCLNTPRLKALYKSMRSYFPTYFKCFCNKMTEVPWCEWHKFDRSICMPHPGVRGVRTNPPLKTYKHY